MLQYFLAPTRDTPPETLIRLGNIIDEPRFADRPLNQTALPIESPVVGSEVKNYTLALDNTNTNNISIWASFLKYILGIGGDVNAQMSKGTTESWTCDKITTVFFEPTTEYIKKTLKATQIKQYIQENRNWLGDANIYMITGLKVAYGATGTVSYARSKGINLHFGVDPTAMGMPFQAGPNIEVEKSRSVTQNIGEKEPFVLAFRMQRIKVSATGEIRHWRQEGGMLGLNDDDVEGDDERIELVVDGLESVDAGAEEFGIRTWWPLEDEGNEGTSNCALAEDR